MYRYIVDNTIVYTPDDLVLFRESPFAVWMERLTLENPEHGIPPDLDSITEFHHSARRDDIVATLRAEGRNVALIDQARDEPDRRAATLQAMRAGADFIVNGQLAVDALAGAVDLLMRTSGFSELGDFLYIPCETRSESSLQSSFRLCFTAEMLANLQGQLPPQMLIIRGDSEIVPLQTEDHIYYYRAVQQRFLNAMNDFRKHRMPDPAESVHFGRWAECASEVLKQRVFSEQQSEERAAVEASVAVVELPQLRVAGGAGTRAAYDRDTASRSESTAANTEFNSTALEMTPRDRSNSGYTLAEQARLLKPGSFGGGTPPGHTPSLTRFGKPRVVAAVQDSAKGEIADKPPVQFAATEALENLAFIGSSVLQSVDNIVSDLAPDSDLDAVIRPAPAPNLRETTAKRESAGSVARITSAAGSLPEMEPRPPVFLPPDSEQAPTVSPPPEQLNTHQHDSVASGRDTRSVVDLDRIPLASLAPVVQRAEAAFKRLIRDDPMFRKADLSSSRSAREDSDSPVSPFSNSLQTSEEFNDS